jgi:hypothetical protein
MSTPNSSLAIGYAGREAIAFDLELALSSSFSDIDSGELTHAVGVGKPAGRDANSGPRAAGAFHPVSAIQAIDAASAPTPAPEPNTAHAGNRSATRGGDGAFTLGDSRRSNTRSNEAVVGAGAIARRRAWKASSSEKLVSGSFVIIWVLREG